MRILLVTPAPAGSLSGNRATANRWARLLRALGHRVDVVVEYQGQRADLMVALHAWRSDEANARFAADHPERPLVVVLTMGTIPTTRYATPSTEQGREAVREIADLHPIPDFAVYLRFGDMGLVAHLFESLHRPDGGPLVAK